MSSLTGVTAIDNTLTGLDDLFLDELDVTNMEANTISLNGTDLQTTLTNLQTQINTSSGGGYFVLTCEFNGNSTNAGFFAFGGGVNSGALEVVLPNCVCIAKRGECTTATLSGGSLVFQKNGTAVNGLGISFVTGDTLVQDLDVNSSFVLGDTISIRFNNAGGTMGGTLWRANYIFRTNPVNGTNGTNGTDGTNGQNVSFNVPTITTITPATTASINDTIVTASGTQTHSLNFNIPRGRNSLFQVGTISSVGTASPSLNITSSTNANGDNVYTMNFGLQQGIQGIQGIQGQKGEQGDQAASTLAAEASATTASLAASAALASATDAAASAGEASIAGAVAGQQAGAEAAQAVLEEQNVRITQLETDVDALQFTTQYISRDNIAETTIGGTKTIVNSTNGLQVNTINVVELNVSDTINVQDGLNVVNDSYFNGDVHIGDTKKLMTNTIVQRQYPANGDILIDATNLDIGSPDTTSIDLKGNDINININTVGGEVTIKNETPNTNVILEVKGDATITNDLTAGTSVNYFSINSHTLNGTTAVNTLKGINNAQAQQILNIGDATNTINMNATNTINMNATNTINMGSSSQTINIGNSTGDTNIQGATIDIGTAGILNAVNIGNAYSIVNIQTVTGGFIDFGNFVNQLGFNPI